MKIDQMSKRLFDGLFHVVLSLMLIDWAVKLPFSFHGIGIYEIAFILLGCVSLIRLFFEKGAVFQNVMQMLRASKWNVFALAGYLLMGIATLFYAQTLHYALAKYIVVVQMLFFGVCFFYYVSVHKKGYTTALKAIYVNIGLSAAFSAIWGMIEYFFFTVDKYPPVVSPINDYNQYSTILLIGLVSMAFFVIKSQLPPVKKYFIAGAVGCAVIPSVVVSGSRRSYVILLFIAALLLLYALGFELFRFTKRKTTKRQLLSGICGVLICAVCICSGSSLLKNVVVSNSGKPVGGISAGSNNNTSDPTSPPPSDPSAPSVPSEPLTPESSLAPDRLSNGFDFGKRITIWRIAVQELQQYNVQSLLFGQGASHSSDIYDDLNNPLVKQLHASYGYNNVTPAEKNWMNAHNLFLQDVLDGGLVLLFLQIAMILSAAVYTIKIMRVDFTRGLVLGLLYCILLVTLCLSSASGIISNKFFWLITMLQMTEYFTIKGETEKAP